MKRYIVVWAGLIAFFTVLYFVAEALELPVLTDPSPWLKEASPVVAVGSVLLLTSDVFLPVPSSLVMAANGALFGVVPGAVLSLAGSLGSALLAFALGRAGSPLLDRLVTPEERRRADRLLARWGATAIVVTRPVPVVAEAVAILAGASPFGWGRMALATLAGSLPAAVLYALVGAGAQNLASSFLVFFVVLAIGGVFAWFGRRLESDAAEGAEG